MDENEVVRKLYETASALVLSSPPPVQLGAICSRFGISIKRNSLKAPGVKRAYLLQTTEATEIVLPEGALTADGFTTWERFLVAHELGHFFLSQFKVPKPLGSREYWNTERVCDKFARQLLLPPREVSQVVTVAGDSTKDLLSATLHLHTKWAVPWPVAALEVADCVKTVHFFRLQSKDDRFRVSASTLPNKLRTGCIIAATSSLGSLLRDLPQNDGKPKQVPVARFGDFEILSRVTDVAVYRAGLSEYRIATRPV